MQDPVMLILVTTVAFFLGTLIGYLISRNSAANHVLPRDIEKQLANSDAQLKEYQQAVTQHFITLSHHTSGVSQAYRDIQEHLASSALRLASPEVSRQIIQESGIDLTLGQHENDSLATVDTLQAPRDYAPKVPGGVLSENYGLDPAGTSDLADSPPQHDVHIAEKTPSADTSRHGHPSYASQ